MDEQVIEIEAESVEEAREQLKLQIPEGLSLLSEQVISDGKPKTVRAVAETTEQAFAKARNEIPLQANFLEEKELIKAGVKVVTVEASDGGEAQEKVRLEHRVKGVTSIKSVRLAIPGSNGFLGIGKKSPQYEVEILQKAVVEITYITKAKIIARVGKGPRIVKAPAKPEGFDFLNALFEGIESKAKLLQGESLLPGEYRVKVFEDYHSAMQGVKSAKIAPMSGPMSNEIDSTAVLAVIVQRERDGSAQLFGVDAEDKWFKLNNFTSSALLFVPKETLPQLQMLSELWSRVTVLML